jgi:glutamate decarboxylase
VEPATLSPDGLAARYGNAFVAEEVPKERLPQGGMAPPDAMRLIDEELTLDGDPQHNLATFVTTWMEPEARRLIAENLHRNFIDHAEYPRTAEIEQRCIRMLADLFHAPGETTGARTQGSSEAIMLGALSLKWNWRKRREAAGASVDRPNLVFGGDVHVVWEKFCRYFDVEPRIVPLQEHKYTIGPEDVEPHVDENTIGVAAVLGTTFTGHMDDIRGINALLARIEDERNLHVPLHVDAASGGFVWPFLYPDSEWDFRLSHVRSINVSGHKYGLVYPGIGWLIFRERSDLSEDLVFYENYLGKTDATFTLNFSTGSAMVLAQYYNLIRFGREGYTYVMELMRKNAQTLSDHLTSIGGFELIGQDEERLPLVAFKLAEARGYDEFDIAWQLSAERGWMVPAYTLPPDAQHVKMMRALVKETLSREMVDTLAGDIAQACRTLDEKGATHESERRRVKSTTGY